MSQSIVRRSWPRPSRCLAVAGLILGLGGCAATGPDRVDVVVRDAASGEVVEGARVYAFDVATTASTACEPVTCTEADGAFVLETPRPGSSWMLVRDGYEPVRFDVPASGSTEVALTPMTYRTVRIGVVDADTGAPVPGAGVVSECRFQVADGCDAAFFGDAWSVGTMAGEDGVAYVEVPAGATCSVTLVAEGHAGCTLVLDPNAAEGFASRVTVPMNAYRYEPTRVVVLDRNTGLPVEGATLRVGLLDPETGDLHHESLWTTDAEGIAIVMKPGAGLGTITVDHAGRLPGEFRVLEIHATDFSSIAIGGDDLD